MRSTEEVVAIAQKAATGTMLAGGASAYVFGTMTAQEIAAYIGAAAAVIGLIASTWISWHWKKKTYDLLEKEVEDKQHDRDVRRAAVEDRKQRRAHQDSDDGDSSY